MRISKILSVLMAVCISGSTFTALVPEAAETVTFGIKKTNYVVGTSGEIITVAENACYASDNTSVITVDENGKFNAVGVGTAKITAESGTVKNDFNITVHAESTEKSRPAEDLKSGTLTTGSLLSTQRRGSRVFANTYKGTLYYKYSISGADDYDGATLGGTESNNTSDTDVYYLAVWEIEAGLEKFEFFTHSYNDARDDDGGGELAHRYRAAFIETINAETTEELREELVTTENGANVFSGKCIEAEPAYIHKNVWYDVSTKIDVFEYTDIPENAKYVAVLMNAGKLSYYKETDEGEEELVEIPCLANTAKIRFGGVTFGYKDTLVSGEITPDGRIALTYSGENINPELTVKVNSEKVTAKIEYDKDTYTQYISVPFETMDTVEITSEYGTWSERNIISVPVNPDAFANNFRTYTKDYLLSGGKGILWSDFETLSNWKEWTNGKTVNTRDGKELDCTDGLFEFNGIDYQIRGYSNLVYSGFTSQANSETFLNNIDVQDGYYSAVSLLGGNRSYKTSNNAWIRFNYADGTSEWKKYTNIPGNSSWGNTGLKISATTDGSEASGNVYIHQMIIECDETKELTSFDFIAKEGQLVKSSDEETGEEIYTLRAWDNELDRREETGYDGYAYDSSYVGITLLKSREFSKNGMDTATEPIEIKASPERGIEAAIEEAKEIYDGSMYIRDVLIILSDGEYEITNTVEIEGFEGYFTIKAENEGKVVLKGSKTIKISDMTDVGNGVKSYELKDVLIPDSVLGKYTTSVSATHSYGVYGNGEIKPLAQYPNNDLLVQQEAVDTVKSNSAITVKNAEFLNIEKTEDMVIEGYFERKYWAHKTSDFTIDGDTITLNGLTDENVTKLKRNWRIYNSIAFLDDEKEWFVDKNSKILYYIPASGEASIEFSVMTDSLINIMNNNVTIEGISFENTAGNAVIFDGVSGIKINNCSFRAIGRTAIYGSNANNTVIENNNIENVGYKGIFLSGGDKETLTESGNVIRNNKITKPGMVVRSYAQGISIDGVGNKVLNNEISDSKSIMVEFKGSLNRIMYNKIIDATSEALDAGAVYSGRNLTYLGNEIAYNHICLSERTNKADEGEVVAGIYLDDGLSGTDVHHNVIENATRGIFTNGGALNEINNNVLSDCGTGVWIGANPFNKFSINGMNLTDYAKAYFEKNPVYMERFENLSELTTDISDFSPQAKVNNNRFMACKTTLKAASYENVTAQVEEINNENVSSLLLGEAQADIDINDIGIPINEMDITVADSIIDGTIARVYHVSGYDDCSVIAAVKDLAGELLSVHTVKNGEAFTVDENAFSIDIYIWNSINGLKPITKKDNY